MSPIKSDGRPPPSPEKFEESLSLFKETRATYLVFILLGMSTLFPWNAFLNAFAYFKHSLKETPYEYSFMSYVVTVYTSILLVMMIGMVIFKLDHRLGVGFKAFAGLTLNLILIVLMAFIPLVEVIKGSPVFGPMTFFWSVLSIVSGTAIATSIMMRSFYTLISLFPGKYVPAFNGGQAVAGVLISLISLTSELITANSKSNAIMLKSIVFYFGASSLILVVTLIGFYWLTCQDEYKRIHVDTIIERSTVKGNIKAFRVGLSLIWELAIGIMMSLTVTIAVISSYITSAKSTGNGVWASTFLPIVFVFFNIGDVVGRWLVAFKPFQFPRRSRKPVFLPWIRLAIFVPLFLTSSMVLEPKFLKTILPEIVRWDWLYLILVLAFGVTGGYTGTILMMIAPDQTQRRFIENQVGPLEDLEATKAHSGSIMGLFINIGLVLGSLGSFLLRIIY